MSSSSSSSLLEKFDPFAIHPFTNYLGSNPKSQSSSKPIPTNNSPSSHSFVAPLNSPQPQSPSKKQTSSLTANNSRPIFVPFRQENSSPELDDLLKKKAPNGQSPNSTRA
ncbi:hypothetical protein BD779DRAFT_1673881 [Infundibulicybe gibba]|nr:hypothetical protein BD779DRAFT_1673881 [Infundibulicybe gibba]